MSGSKQKSSSKTTNTQTLNPWSQQQWQQQADTIRGNITDYRNGITPYGGQLTAGLSGSEQQAGGLIDQYTGNYQPQMNNLNGMLDQSNFTQVQPQTFADFNADTYVNPYAQQMIDATTGDLQRTADRQRTQSTSDSLANNAYGGSRQGVREGMIDESLLNSVANMSAQTRYNVWDQGANRFYQDVGNQTNADQYNNNLQLQRTQGLAGLLDQQQGYQNNDVQRLMDYGATTRGVEDRALAAQYADYLRQRQEQQTAMGLDFGLLGSTPMLINSSGTSNTTQSTNPGALGIAGTLMGGAGAMFGGQGLFSSGGIFGPKG